MSARKEDGRPTPPSRASAGPFALCTADGDAENPLSIGFRTRWAVLELVLPVTFV